jgi:outer membrane murein-binding lipoprotein Lpp
MATGRRRLLGLLTAMTAIAPFGCAQSGPMTSRNTMLGSLKASVSQLEFDNEKLRKEVAELKSDNARLDTQLAQEREANGEVTARLDDAKNLLRRQGGDVQALGIPPKSFDDDGIPPPTRRTKGGRKPPSANIPRSQPAPFDSPDDRGFDSTSTERSRDLGPIDRADDDRWLPVARGLGSSIAR